MFGRFLGKTVRPYVFTRVRGCFSGKIRVRQEQKKVRPKGGTRMSNKSEGTIFEKEFAQILSEHGFWAHRMQDNANGQPFDVIAAKNGETLVFDCKNCSGERFYFRRIEENQRNAMRLWQECGNPEGIFAVKYANNEIFLFSLSELEEAEKNGIRYIAGSHAKYYGSRLEDWFERLEKYESNDQ